MSNSSVESFPAGVQNISAADTKPPEDEVDQQAVPVKTTQEMV
jgi:hypothetical protein